MIAWTGRSTETGFLSRRVDPLALAPERVPPAAGPYRHVLDDVKLAVKAVVETIRAFFHRAAGGGDERAE